MITNKSIYFNSFNFHTSQQNLLEKSMIIRFSIILLIKMLKDGEIYVKSRHEIYEQILLKAELLEYIEYESYIKSMTS